MSETEFIDWLLSARTASIRYQTLTDLLGYPAEDARVTAARQAIMADGPVPAILARQTESGAWEGDRSYYTPKYVSAQWSMILLTELCVAGDDPRFQKSVRCMLETTAGDLRRRLETDTRGFSCFWGNLLRYALHAGMLSHVRVETLIEYTLRDLQTGPCQCLHNSGYACAWGVARMLWGLAAIPTAQRTVEVNQAIKRGVSFLLDSFKLEAANYPTPNGGEVSQYWFKLNFPLFYQADILFTLRVLGELGELQHPGVQGALDWLAQARKSDGSWPGSSPFRQRTWRELGDRDETQRWVSLQAAHVLMQAGRLSGFAGLN